MAGAGAAAIRTVAAAMVSLDDLITFVGASSHLRVKDHIDGVKRYFPAEKLLGAEEVLARLWHEHTKTKDYKPLGLGEIVSRRTWTSGMDLNTMAANRSAAGAGATVKLVDGALVAEDTCPPSTGSKRRNGHGCSVGLMKNGGWSASPEVRTRGRL